MEGKLIRKSEKKKKKKNGEDNYFHLSIKLDFQVIETDKVHASVLIKWIYYCTDKNIIRRNDKKNALALAY